MQQLIVPTVAKNVPVYARPGDAGADLCAAAPATIPARGRALVSTGVKVALPEGHALFVHPRSGLALKSGITVLNTPGTIDAGYRGDIGVILFNTTDEPFEVAAGDRIAQAVVQRVERIVFETVDSLDESERGTNGFGSTGVTL